MSGKRYKSKHKVLYYECEKTYRMTLSMLLNVLIQVSGEQSSALGLGDEKMGELGYAWIVLQHAFDIHRMPVTNELIEIETQARQYNSFFCYRDFYVYSETGTLLVEFTMVFAIMDRNERKMIRIPEEIVSPYGAPFKKGLIRIPRPSKVDEKIADSSFYTIRYFDIDVNDHVNNAKYIEWMLDALGEEFLKNKRLKTGTIKFEKELLYGQTAESKSSRLHTKEKTVTAHEIRTEAGFHCSASFEWK